MPKDSAFRFYAEAELSSAFVNYDREAALGEGALFSAAYQGKVCHGNIVFPVSNNPLVTGV